MASARRLLARVRAVHGVWEVHCAGSLGGLLARRGGLVRLRNERSTATPHSHVQIRANPQRAERGIVRRPPASSPLYLTSTTHLRDLPGGPESRSRRQLVAFLPKELPVAEGDVLEFTLGRCAPSVRLHSCRLAASGGSDHKRGEMGGAEGAGREGSENACMEKWHWPMARHPRTARFNPLFRAPERCFRVPVASP